MVLAVLAICRLGSLLTCDAAFNLSHLPPLTPLTLLTFTLIAAHYFRRFASLEVVSLPAVL